MDGTNGTGNGNGNGGLVGLWLTKLFGKSWRTSAASYAVVFFGACAVICGKPETLNILPEWMGHTIKVVGSLVLAFLPEGTENNAPTILGAVAAAFYLWKGYLTPDTAVVNEMVNGSAEVCESKFDPGMKTLTAEAAKEQ